MQHQLLQYPPDKKIQNYLFSFKAKLGKGAYGTVYLGKNEVNNNIVALKVIDKKILSTEYAQQLINQEIEIMKKIDNKYIVKLIDVFHSVNNTYIITEHCNGGDLREYLKIKKLLPEDEALRVIKNIIFGLKDLVNVGIIHRDIKPANILIHDNNFKITDFGFAREVQNHNETVMNSLVGTPLYGNINQQVLRYMSPQILKRQCYTSKCDIWSIGLILFEMLYGVTPWHSHNLIELMSKLDSKPLMFPSTPRVSDQTKDLIKQCLQLREDKRIDWETLFKHPIINIKVDIGRLLAPSPDRIRTQVSSQRVEEPQQPKQYDHNTKQYDNTTKQFSKQRSNSNMQVYIPTKYAQYYNIRTFKNYFDIPNQANPRVKTDADQKPSQGSRERSQSSIAMEKFKTQVIEANTPPMGKYGSSGNSSHNDSLRTPSALNSHSTNATISSNRARVPKIAQFEPLIQQPTNDYQPKHEKKRSIFNDIKIQQDNIARLKRTNSLTTKLTSITQYLTTPNTPNKHILGLIKVILNQLDLLPSHIEIKRELAQLIESQRRKISLASYEQIYNREDQLKCKLSIQSLNSFIERNKRDNFIVQIQVMILLLTCLYHIITANITSKSLIIPQALIDQIKKFSEVQQLQLQLSQTELQQQIYLQQQSIY